MQVTYVGTLLAECSWNGKPAANTNTWLADNDKDSDRVSVRSLNRDLVIFDMYVEYVPWTMVEGRTLKTPLLLSIPSQAGGNKNSFL